MAAREFKVQRGKGCGMQTAKMIDLLNQMMHDLSRIISESVVSRVCRFKSLYLCGLHFGCHRLFFNVS